MKSYNLFFWDILKNPKLAIPLDELFRVDILCKKYLILAGKINTKLIEIFNLFQFRKSFFGVFFIMLIYLLTEIRSIFCYFEFPYWDNNYTWFSIKTSNIHWKKFDHREFEFSNVQKFRLLDYSSFWWVSCMIFIFG